VFASQHHSAKGVIRMTAVYVRDFPEEIHKAAKLQAVKEDTSLRELVIKAVAFYLKAVKGNRGGK
jgi:predicted HicB family RNase H-like nuclease